MAPIISATGRFAWFYRSEFERLDPVMPPILKSLHIIPGSGVI
jgi:hypothetical protein